METPSYKPHTYEWIRTHHVKLQEAILLTVKYMNVTFYLVNTAHQVCFSSLKLKARKETLLLQRCCSGIQSNMMWFNHQLMDFNWTLFKQGTDVLYTGALKDFPKWTV